MVLATTVTKAQLLAGAEFENSPFKYVVTTAEEPGSPNTVSLSGVVDGATLPEALVIPASVYEGGVDYAITLISSGAIKGKSITSLVVEGDTQPGFQSFMDCSNLVSISLPISSGAIGAQAFRNCTSLTDVNVPNILLIGVQSFRNCTALETLSLPKTTAIGTKFDEGLTFWQCSNLKTISMPVMDSISVGAFNGTGLTSITLPASITKLSEKNYNMFRNISTLTKVIVESTTPLPLTYSDPLEVSTSSIFNAVADVATLTVPNGTLAAYKAAPVWRDFSSIIEAAPTAAVNSVTNESFDAYPNPVVDVLSFSTDDIYSVDIYNTIGAKVASKSAVNGVDMSNLSQGVYYVKCKNEEGVAISTIKVVKN